MAFVPMHEWKVSLKYGGMSEPLGQQGGGLGWGVRRAGHHLPKT